ncbi:MAG: RidA family protein [Gammaproteobacteria bacterium]|nr:RidA family protein [Gammaproteobacteria bacterium]
MDNRDVIQTEKAPAAIGTYSQAVRVGQLLFISGQIPLQPQSMELVQGGLNAQARRVFDNLEAIAQAAGSELNAAVKINISMTDLADFASVNSIMAEYFSLPYPARACVQVAALPKGALIEVEAVLAL